MPVSTSVDQHPEVAGFVDGAWVARTRHARLRFACLAGLRFACLAGLRFACLAGLLLVVASTWLPAAPAAADQRSDADKIEALIKAEKLQDAVAKAEAALPTASDPRVGELLAEACEKLAIAMAQKDRPGVELLAMVDRGLRGQRTVRLMKFRGRILQALERSAEAYESYEEALDLGPDGKHQADIVGEMGTIYRSLCDRMCRLTVTSNDKGAALRVGVATDGRKLPTRMWLPRGHHVLRTTGTFGEETRELACGSEPVSVHVALPDRPLPKVVVEPRRAPAEAGRAPSGPQSKAPPFVPKLDDVAGPRGYHAWGPWAVGGLGLAAVGLGAAWNVHYNTREPGTQNAGEKTAALSAYAASGTLLLSGLAWWWLERRDDAAVRE